MVFSVTASISASAASDQGARDKSSIQSPARRAWRRFRSNRLGYVSLIIFAILFGLSLFAEALSNDKPLVVRYNGHWYFPVVQTLPETTFGGDFPTPTDYLDPLIRENLSKGDNFALFPPNAYHHSTINYFAKEPSPSGPDAENLLGTDDRGRDILARLIYGFRVSVVFALLVATL
ncbi:MAG: peptide transporter permease, partial [Betaproteobacteria bacterium]|nr:peptide transporter permease [Betaproteobacteria bacterium]